MGIGDPNVFIIESLKLEDELHEEKFEGKILSQILRLNRKEPIYYYIRTKTELTEMLKEFGESDYRYLHLSCHANPKLLATTFDSLSFAEFGSIARRYLNGRRVFLSACAAVNKRLAKEIFRESGCQSLIGPSRKIGFGDAAIAWATFYHMMFKENQEKMIRGTITEGLKTIQSAFGVNMRYYTREDSSEGGFRRVTYLD
jgi:hypothetical protein